MSTGHRACFKHLMADCGCDSPRKSDIMHHSTRIPKKGNLSDWKVFLKWMYERRYRGPKPDLSERVKGTRLESYYLRLVRESEKE